jgi:hypothetical protein
MAYRQYTSADVIKFFTKAGQMVKETETKNSPYVDKGLVAMFLRMSPEERLLGTREGQEGQVFTGCCPNKFDC